MVHRDEWQVEQAANKEFEQIYTKPTYAAPQFDDAPRVVTHSNGRIWLEVSEDDYSNRGSAGEFHITLGSESKVVTMRPDQMELLIEELNTALTNVNRINRIKQEYQAALKKWEQDKESYAKVAVSQWKKENPPEKKTRNR